MSTKHLLLCGLFAIVVATIAGIIMRFVTTDEWTRGYVHGIIVTLSWIGAKQGMKYYIKARS